ncbi:hypothetical protein Hdeb2414_s0450g00896411 [Helianthus debilis subsp. tardiflorus]
MLHGGFQATISVKWWFIDFRQLEKKGSRCHAPTAAAPVFSRQIWWQEMKSKSDQAAIVTQKPVFCLHTPTARFGGPSPSPLSLTLF